MAMYDGPNTIDHFSAFSLESIRAEIKQTAPALFQLFTTLSHSAVTGDDDQSGDDTNITVSSFEESFSKSLGSSAVDWYDAHCKSYKS